MLSDESLEQLQDVNAIAWRCVKTFHFFEITSGPGGQFWNLTQNVMGENCCLLWGHLFGKANDDLHYSKFFSRSDILASGPQFEPPEVKKRIILKAGFDDITYKEFWRTMNTIRDKYLAHRDLDQKIITFPNLKICACMAIELRNILSELVLIHYRMNPNHDELSLLNKYFTVHPSSGLEDESKEEFQDGLELISDQFGPA